MEWTEYQIDGNDYIPLEQWGKDHWSTLAYLETQAVDGGGCIDNRKMRCNPRLHGELANVSASGSLMDGSKYPTLLAGNKERENHDDWSCLEDMVAEGLLKAWYKVTRPNQAFDNSVGKIELTELGWKVAGQLRMHKARGGRYSEFSPVL